MYQKTTALKKIKSLTKRIRICQGGTSASKTVSILLYLIDIAQRENVTISVVAESLPHLKLGALKDFLSIMKLHGYYHELNYNKSDKIYTFETGATMVFHSVDEPEKVRGPRRDILFINEANNISFETFDQLEVRTNRFVILDYNPTSEFWVHTEVIPRFDHDFIKLTYLDNEALEPQIRKSIESRKDKLNWWNVYGLGELGVLEGAIYSSWQTIDTIPDEARLEARGLDFGFTNHPTAIVDVYYHDNGYILDEQLYRSGMTNPEIASFMKSLPRTVTVADSAEPKSIEEISLYGIDIVPALKGPGSVNYGIQLVQDQNIRVTKRSLNLIKEYRNYKWRTDRDGKATNKPEEVWDHCMDAVRYPLSYIKQGNQVEVAFI